jgi:hypothetical protein
MSSIAASVSVSGAFSTSHHDEIIDRSNFVSVVVILTQFFGISSPFVCCDLPNITNDFHFCKSFLQISIE